MNPQEQEPVLVRNLRPRDLEAVIELDRHITGRRRTEYFKVKLAQALADTGVQVSLAADVDGRLAGFLLARVYYGEFGAVDKVAVLDTIGVHPDRRGTGIGWALLKQLRTNLLGLGIQQVRTEVGWDDPALLSFFQHAGFRPAPRFCVELDLAKARTVAERAELAQQG